MQIILVRHGRTAWNEKKVFRGRADIPLDETGFRQARAAAQRLSSYPLDAIYSSPLQRSWETAQIIAQKADLRPQMESNLIDMDFGDWEGMSQDEVRQKFPAQYDRWLKEPHAAKIPNGDDLNLVSRRVSAALNTFTQSGYATLAVVSHRVVLKVLLCLALGRGLSSFWGIKQDVAAISVLEYRDGTFDPVRLNDTGHLEANGAAEEMQDF